MQEKELSQTEILNTMLDIIRDQNIRPLRSYVYQLPDDLKAKGAIVRWISPSRKSYLAIREAANKKGLWFGFVRSIQRMADGGEEFSVFVVQDRRNKPR